jgi:hypothetical protein
MIDSSERQLAAKIDELSKQVAKIELMLNRDMALLASRLWLLERVVAAVVGLSLLESWLIIFWLRG